jgi:chloramphenicol O-acetyltransferase
MNFKAIKRAEELRLNIENQDKEIIELEKVMYSLAIQDG